MEENSDINWGTFIILGLLSLGCFYFVLSPTSPGGSFSNLIFSIPLLSGVIGTIFAALALKSCPLVEARNLGTLLGTLLKILFGLVVIFLLGSWIWEKTTSWYYGREITPFWDGTNLIQVCKTPYYSNEECYKLNVTLIDPKTAKIQFNNGGYKITGDLTCYYSTEIEGLQERYKFCRSWDSEGQQWDFMPMSAYYPSIEDINKHFDNLMK